MPRQGAQSVICSPLQLHASLFRTMRASMGATAQRICRCIQPRLSRLGLALQTFACFCCLRKVQASESDWLAVSICKCMHKTETYMKDVPSTCIDDCTPRFLFLNASLQGDVGIHLHADLPRVGEDFSLFPCWNIMDFLR